MTKTVLLVNLLKGISILLILSVTLGSGLDGFAQNRAKPVAVDTVILEPLLQTTPVLGRIVAIQRGTVTALTRGPVLEVHVNVGDRVREGDLLVTQATDRLEKSRNIAKEAMGAALASVETARSQLHLAEQELERLERLKGSAAFSAAQRDDKSLEVAVRRAQVGEARAEVARTRARLKEAQLDVDLGIIRAPYNGVVIERHTVRGAYLSVGDAAITLINDEDLEIEADIPTERLSGLSRGRDVMVTFTGHNTKIEASVRAILPEEDALTRTRLVRFLPDFRTDLPFNPAAGQVIVLDIPTGEAKTVLSVHKDAVLPQDGSNHVYQVTSDKTVTQRRVELGEATGSRFVVLNGLDAGDMVVIRGNERLHPGDPVKWPDETASQDASDMQSQ